MDRSYLRDALHDRRLCLGGQGGQEIWHRTLCSVSRQPDASLHTANSHSAIAIYLSFMIVVVLLDIVEMIMFFCHKLTPLPFLTMSSFQAGFWSGASLMEIVYIGKFGTSAGGLGVSVFFILYFATLIYAAIGYHRARKQRNLGKYAPAHNPASPDHDHDLPAYNGYSVPNQNTAYQSPYTIPHPNQDAATGYYTEAPTKPAAIV
ncbi:hypothetical protein P280DRAFT_273674 [Massarina eburnea CBS 473.64]|uniref:Uncharacterized protein n=1 Tax=Massarina eburnea CBS 473.64 TaxID=1395130 RepID=A0A6A6S6V1_9PLEO|nr:hypothetical protein P280DRAFT_273674 [Massarina eburnea CBS 473.64]